MAYKRDTIMAPLCSVRTMPFTHLQLSKRLPSPPHKHSSAPAEHGRPLQHRPAAADIPPPRSARAPRSRRRRVAEVKGGGSMGRFLGIGFGLALGLAGPELPAKRGARTAGETWCAAFRLGGLGARKAGRLKNEGDNGCFRVFEAWNSCTAILVGKHILKFSALDLNIASMSARSSKVRELQKLLTEDRNPSRHHQIL